MPAFALPRTAHIPFQIFLKFMKNTRKHLVSNGSILYYYIRPVYTTRFCISRLSRQYHIHIGSLPVVLDSRIAHLTFIWRKAPCRSANIAKKPTLTTRRFARIATRQTPPHPALLLRAQAATRSRLPVRISPRRIGTRAIIPAPAKNPNSARSFTTPSSASRRRCSSSSS